MYWTFFVLYVVLTIAFAVDVVRNPALTVAGKVLWILALLLAPVLAWLVYGIWRLRESRGL